jgi:hypothetical protein
MGHGGSRGKAIKISITVTPVFPVVELSLPPYHYFVLANTPPPLTSR